MEDSAPINKKPEANKPNILRSLLISLFPSVNRFLTLYGAIMTSEGRFYVPVHSEIFPHSKEREET